MEEQGRTSLHTHIQVWIVGVNDSREKLHSNNRNEKREAERDISKMVDKVASTKLFFPKSDFKGPNFKRSKVNKAFPHQCTVVKGRKRKNPVVVDEQQLRNLRHRSGKDSKRGMFAYCPHCTKFWTNAEFVESYLINAKRIPGSCRAPRSCAKAHHFSFGDRKNIRCDKKLNGITC